MTKAENSGYEWSKNSRQGTNRHTLVMTEGPTGGRSKPVCLIEHLISIFSKPGQLVLDPFMGSGSHGVAALNLGRRFIGFEPVPEYFLISKRRLMGVAPLVTEQNLLVAAE